MMRALNRIREANMTREQQKHATRANILASAKQLFAAQGYHAVSTRQIANHAGVGTGTVFAHFKDKYELTKALFLADIDQQLAQNQTQFDDAQTGLAWFSAQSHALYRYYELDRALSIALLQNSLFDQAFFAQQLNGFLQQLAERLKTDAPQLNDQERMVLAHSWFGFYFFNFVIDSLLLMMFISLMTGTRK